MSEVKMKKWNMRSGTRTIVSEAFKLCKEMNETYSQRVTIRQIYYHLFSKGMIELTQRDYHRVCHILTEARKRGYVPFNWVEDRSRNPMWTMLDEDLEHFLDRMMTQYKRNTWKNQDNFIIILVEKEALAPIIWDIAKKYNVPVFPTKGFSSWSMFVEDLKQLVEYFGEDNKLIVLVLSDLDPSGKYITEDYENKFKFMVEELGFTEPHLIDKIAITNEQVEQYNLPPMQKKYKNKGVLNIWELDALEPKILRELVKKAIEKHLDLELLGMDMEIEKKEKKNLNLLIEHGIETYSDDIGEDE
jgi:hypothetical protein